MTLRLSGVGAACGVLLTLGGGGPFPRRSLLAVPAKSVGDGDGAQHRKQDRGGDRRPVTPQETQLVGDRHAGVVFRSAKANATQAASSHPVRMRAGRACRRRAHSMDGTV